MLDPLFWGGGRTQIYQWCVLPFCGAETTVRYMDVCFGSQGAIGPDDVGGSTVEMVRKEYPPSISILQSWKWNMSLLEDCFPLLTVSSFSASRSVGGREEIATTLSKAFLFFQCIRARSFSSPS